jgi:hypothetical protein
MKWILSLLILMFIVGCISQIDTPIDDVIIDVPVSSNMLIKECSDPEYITVQSDYIVEGVVENIETSWNGDNTQIYTTVTFTINNNIKGDLSDSTQFELPGGCVDEICEYIEDQSIFNLGEELRLNLYDFNGKLSIVCGPFGIKQLPKIPIQPKYGNLDDYYKSIDYSCNQDRDCVIKDTHNCCGYYPKCTNKNAVVDTEFVNSECGKEGLASVCGFPSINYCTCSENLCEGSFIEVNSFDECVAEGNPVMESYPRQCRSSEGVTFIEEI